MDVLCKCLLIFLGRPSVEGYEGEFDFGFFGVVAWQGGVFFLDGVGVAVGSFFFRVVSLWLCASWLCYKVCFFVYFGSWILVGSLGFI